MAKKNVKKWLLEHERDIRDVAWWTLGAIAGCCGFVIANRIIHHNDLVISGSKVLKHVLSDSDKIVGNKVVFGGVCNIQLTPDRLGELGKAIMDCPDYCPGETFTHFIAIGKVA